MNINSPQFPNTIINNMERVSNRYNGDNDIIPNTPVVTWSDQQLVEAVWSLANHIKELSKRVWDLETIVAELKDPSGKNSR
jgi:hypothetical protein